MNIVKTSAVVNMYNKLSKLPLGSVTAKGWIKDQLLRSKAGMGGHLDELEPKMIARPFIDYSMFEHENRTFAAGWSSEISGTYWTGLVQLAYTLNDDELKKKATDWVEGVLKHQEPDGYLGGYPADTDRLADYNAWGANWCYRALLSYYDATGREDVLKAVYRGLLWFCDNWKDHKTDYVGSTIIESMICVYALTGDKRLVDFSENWLAWLEDNSPLQNKVSIYLSPELPYTSMHTVAYGEDVKHPALVYLATGEKRMLDASVNGMNKALKRIVQPTGGPGSNGEYLSPVSGVTETEYCNFSTFDHSYIWLCIATKEARYGDYLERCVFNGAQGARRKDERSIAYMSSPNQLRANRNSSTFSLNGADEVYAPNFHVACCPAQSIRTVPEFVRAMCMSDAEDDLYLLCYGPASVNGKKLAFEMDTGYPFREKIMLTVTKADGARLFVRIPDWCKAPTFEKAGKTCRLIPAEGGFFLLDEKLSVGDVINITFPMPVTSERVDDSDAASKFPILYKRGPILFSLPIPTQWTSYEGTPRTPLPEGWAWYEAQPDFTGVSRFREPWSVAADETLDLSKITVTEKESSYVWEDPAVELTVPMRMAPYTYRMAAAKNLDPTEQTRKTEGDPIPMTLVPFGCTNLRITYFPRERKE